MARRDEDDARSEFHRMLDAGALETGDVLQYRRDEVPQRVLRRLGRGEYSAQDELALHHADLAPAEAMPRPFLRAASASPARSARSYHRTRVRQGSHTPHQPPL